MLTIQDYLDRACERHRFWSGRELARALDVSAATQNAWRTGRSLPEEDAMMKLAHFAGVSPEQALLELSYWRADGEAKDTYEKLIKRLGVTAAALALLICSTNSALAAPIAVTYPVAHCILWKLLGQIKAVFKQFFLGCNPRGYFHDNDLRQGAPAPA